MHDCPPPDPANDRLRLLIAFVTQFAPTIADKRSNDGVLADDAAPPEVIAARNSAIVAAFGAIERVAATS